MPLFLKKKEKTGVRTFVLKLVNNNCSEIDALFDGPRAETRVRLTVVVQVVPLINGKPAFERKFAAVTKEFSSSGVSLVVNDPRAVEDVILAFRWEDGMTYVRGRAKYLNPLGAGFYQLGVELTEMVHPSDCPGMKDVAF